MKTLESPGKVPEFFGNDRLGTPSDDASVLKL